ncbi:MAG: alpha-E domain-containing protein, partial [Planctomycetaceae bacterium]|nr:alpha-E domain-containing protein [Planctomycetaceae bacterium]
GVVDGSQNLAWKSILQVVQQPIPDDPGIFLHEHVTGALTFDMSNQSSIMTSVNRARNNARSIRGSISTDMWRELNRLYWLLTDDEFRRRSFDSPHELYQAVQTGSQMFQGVCDATISHDEGWHFIQLGKYLERADKITRLVDYHQQQLEAIRDSLVPSLQNLHWAGLLKSCQAYQAYQQRYISRVDPERVLEFILFNPDFPYSVRFCLKAAAENLAAIGGGVDSKSERGGRAGRLLGRTLLELEYSEPNDVLGTDLRTFLNNIETRCSQVVLAVREQYSLY